MAELADPIIEAMKAEQNAAPQPEPTEPRAPPSVPSAIDVAPEEDPVISQMKAEREQLRQLGAKQLKYSAEHDNADPGKRAEALSLSGVTGMDPYDVEANIDTVRAEVKAKATKADWELMTYRQPGLVRMLQQQPAMMPLVKDDTANLAGIEWALGTWGKDGFTAGAPFHAFWDALNEQRIVGRQFVNAMPGMAEWGNIDKEDNRAAIQDLEKKYAQKDYGNDGAWSTATIATARMLPFLSLDILSRTTGAALGAFALGGEGGAATAETGPGAAGGATVGAVAGVGLGQFIGSGVFNYYETLGPNFERLSQLKDATGNPLDPNLVQALAQSSAFASGLLMAGAGGKLGSAIAKPLFSRLAASSVEKALTDASVSSLMKRGATEFGKHWLTGATLMGAQSMVNQSTVEIGKGLSGQPFEQDGTPTANILNAGKEGFIGGLKDMWLLSAIAPGRELIRDLGRARASAEGAARLEAMSEAAASSKLLERSPDAFEKTVAELKKPSAAEKNVFIPAEEWTRYWQEKKVSPGDIAGAVMGDDGKAYADALQTKGDIVIPVEKYLKSFAKTPHILELAQDVKLRAEDSTPRQAALEQKELSARMEREAKARAPELDEGKKAVHSYIRDMAVKAGHDKGEAGAVAKLVSDYVGAMALRLNVSVPEAATRGNLGGLRILGPKGEAIIKATQEHFAQFMRPTPERFLEQRLATMSHESRAKESYIDAVSGLRNQKAFEEMGHHKLPGGVITSLDTKGINDSPTGGGHHVANDMMRAMGASAGKGHEEAARGGTNFFVNAKSEAEFKDVLERTRKVNGDLNIVGAYGENAKAAQDALDADIYRRRQATEEGKEPPPPLKPGETALPKRGELNPKLDVAGLKFGEERGAATVPPELLEKIRGMSNEDYAREFYLDKVKVGGKDEETGMLTRQAWDALPRKAHAAMLDMKGLRDANLAYGKDIGNKMLFKFADLVSELGGSSFDATHLSGDEYALQHDDPVELQRFIERVKAKLGTLKVTAENAVSGRKVNVPVDFRHGIGTDLADADRDLNTKKRAEGGVGAENRGPGDGQADLGAGGRPGRDAKEAQGALEGTGVGEPRRQGDAGNDALRGAGALQAAQGEAVRGQGATRITFRQRVVAHVEGAPVVLGERPEDTSFDFGANAPSKEGHDFIDKMKDPEKQSAANAFVDYAEGKSEQRPVIEPALERELAKYGWVDPEGYPFDENGRDLSATAANRRSDHRPKGEQPDALKESAQAKTGRWWMKLQQFPTAEQSLENMNVQRVFNDLAQATGATVVDSADSLIKMLHEYRYGGGDEHQVAHVVYYRDRSQKGRIESKTFENVKGHVGDAGKMAEDFIRRHADEVYFAATFDPRRKLTPGEEERVREARYSNASQLEALGLGSQNSFNNFGADENLGVDVQPGILRSGEDTKAKIPPSKSLPGQAEAERATAAGGLGSILKAWKVETPEGYSGKVVLKQEPRHVGPVWYSAVDRAVGQAKQEKNTPAAWLSVIEKSAGVKKEEVDFMGLREWLKEQKGSITRADVQKFIDAHKVNVEEQELTSADETSGSQYENYTVGGHRPDSYKELLFRAPGTSATGYKAPHFGSQGEGVLAHARISEHKTADGKPLLFVEEIQSDLHQAAREKGYERRTDKAKKLLDARHHAADNFMSIAHDAGLTDGPGRQLARAMREDFADGKMEGRALGSVENLTPDDIKRIETAGRALRAADLAWRAEASKKTAGETERRSGSRADAKDTVFNWLAEGNNRFDIRQDSRGEFSPVTPSGEWGPSFSTKEAALEQAQRNSGRYGVHVGTASQATLEHLKAPPEVLAAFHRLTLVDDGPPRVPNAPFKTTWDEMVAKRLIRYAAEKGYEKIGWTTGDQQATRYDLSHYVDRIDWFKHPDGTYDIAAMKEEHEALFEKKIPESRVKELLGAEASSKIFQGVGKRASHEDGTIGTLKGLELKVGGEGMKAAYDRRIPGIFEKLVKKYGGEVSQERLDIKGGKYTVPDQQPDGWAVKDPDGDLISRGHATREAAEGEATRLNEKFKKRGDKPKAWTVTIPEELRKTVLREGMPLFSAAREMGGKARGHIALQLDPNGRPREMSISAFQGDKSTLLHETEHFLSWSFHDIAESDLATPQVKEDYAVLLKWAGYKSVKDRLFRTKEIEALMQKGELSPGEERKLRQLTAGEEKISHGFEQYLAEGKAPSPNLARVFSKFRGWLTSIYRGLPGIQKQYQTNYGQELGLSDEVRDIFARLLGQDEALAQAERDTGEVYGPKPPPLPTGSMSPAERDAWGKAIEAARVSSERELAQRTAQLQGGDVEQVRAGIREEVTQELDKQSIFRAQRYLQHGEVVDADGKLQPEVPDVLLTPDGKTMKLDRKAFVAKFGKDNAALMPRGVFAKDGVSADALAPLLGFSDGAEMVDAFKSTEPRDRAIARETQERVSQTFGPALDSMTQAAMSAVHNEHRSLATWLELRALAKEVDPAAGRRVNAMDPAALKKNAQALIEGKVLGDLDPDAYARAERQAAIKAASLRAKDKAGSLEQGIGRLFNQFLYRAAKDAADRLETVRKKLEGTSQSIRANLGKADPSYRDVHDSLLAAVGLGKPPAEGALGLDAMVAKLTADGQSLDVDADALRQLLAKPKDWEQLMVAEAKNFSDAITNIRHLARETNEVELKGKRWGKLAWLKSLADRVASVQQPQPKMPFSRTAEGFTEKGRRLRRGAQTLLEDVETWAEMLDGGTKGPAHDLLIGARIDCRTKENELSKQVLKPIKEAWEKIPKDIRKLKDRVVDVKDWLPVKNDTLAPIFTRDTLWDLFMHWGSEGNRQRIRDGNGWTDENVEKALSLLSEPELDFLQTVKDTINSLYPELAKVHEKRTGLPLGKVDAVPVTLNGKTYAGGYHPLKYDSRSSRPGELQEADSVKDLFGSNYQRPTLPSGHTKGRVAVLKNAAVDLTWATVPAHLSQVIRDISYGDWVRQAGSLMLSPEFKGLTTKFLGEERAKEFVPWLRDVANARADSAAGHQSDFMRRFGSAARSKLSLMVMGLNLPSLMRHSFDPWSTMADSEMVAPQHIAGAYLKVINPQNWSRPEYAASKELANHEAKLHDNLREELGRIGPDSASQFARIITAVSFKAHELVHHFTARVVFQAGYDSAIANGATPEEAVQRGDDVVRRALPSGDIAEKPPILRTKTGWASAVMFYGYASKMHNLRARSFDAALRTWQSPTADVGDRLLAISTVAGKWLALGAVASLGAYFAGRGWKRDEDNPKGALKWAGEELLLDPMEGVPIVGPAAKALITGHEANIGTSPEISLVQESVTRFQHTVEKAKSTGSKRDADKVWAAVEALLAAMGPSGFVKREFGDINAQRKKEFRPKGALGQAEGAFYGAPKADGTSSVNPLQHLQKALK